MFEKKAKIEIIKKKIEPFLKERGFASAGIFGSVARGQETADSDIDILVQTPTDRKFSLVDLIKTEDELSTILGRKVDLVTERGVSPYMKKYIYQDLQVIYE